MMDICNAINGSKVAWALSAMCVNMGSRFIIQEMTPLQVQVFSHPVFKRIVIFCIVFIATRDILLAAAFALLAWIVLEHILHENSVFCIAPGMCRLAGQGGTTVPVQPVVTRSMYAKALETVRSFDVHRTSRPVETTAKESTRTDESADKNAAT